MGSNPTSDTAPPPDDAELIARVVATADMPAFGELIGRHERAVRALLGSLCRGRRAQVDDLAQETFLRALKALPQAQDASRFRAWLTAIAYREFLMWRRSEQRYRAVLTEAAETSEDLITPDHGAARLERYLGVLNEQERSAIVLNHGAGLTQLEIAATMGLPLGTVKSLISRGKRRIQQAFAPQPPTAPPAQERSAGLSIAAGRSEKLAGAPNE